MHLWWPPVAGCDGSAPAGIRNAKSYCKRCTLATRAKGVPRNQEPHIFICTRTPAVPLSVKPLSQRGARNARRSVSPVTAEPGINPLLVRSHQAAFEGGGGGEGRK